MRIPHLLFLLSPGIVLLGGCASLPDAPSVSNDSAPSVAGYSLDRAAAACLDWAWSVHHAREVAGGVLFDEAGGLACSPLTIGMRNSVEYRMDARWLAHFHTHVGPGRSSRQDRDTVAHQDPMGRPGYVREPSGTVWAYECHPAETASGCRERKVRPDALHAADGTSTASTDRHASR